MPPRLFHVDAFTDHPVCWQPRCGLASSFLGTGLWRKTSAADRMAKRPLSRTGGLWCRGQQHRRRVKPAATANSRERTPPRHQGFFPSDPSVGQRIESTSTPPPGLLRGQFLRPPFEAAHLSCAPLRSLFGCSQTFRHRFSPFSRFFRQSPVPSFIVLLAWTGTGTVRPSGCR